MKAKNRTRYSNSNKVLGAYMPLNTYALVREQAHIEGITPSAWLTRLATKELKKKGTTIKL